MQVQVRAARPEEFDAAGRLVAQAYVEEGHTRPDSEYVDELLAGADRARHADLLVAVDEAMPGALLGTVTYADAGTAYAELARPGDGELRMLAVATVARGRGVGTALVRACLDLARARGRRRLVLSTQDTMLDAHRMYERLGFARAPELDWSPVPGLVLRAYRQDL